MSAAGLARPLLCTDEVVVAVAAEAVVVVVAFSRLLDRSFRLNGRSFQLHSQQRKRVSTVIASTYSQLASRPAFA